MKTYRMSRFVDSLFSFLGRRSSKDQTAETAVTRRRRGKAVLEADSFVFLPGECTSSGNYLWGEIITPRTVGVPPSSYSDDYSVLSGGDNIRSRRKKVQSVLIDSSGKLVGRRLSGSFVAKAVKNHKTLDEVGDDGSLGSFLKEFESEEDKKYHTYDRANTTTRSEVPEEDTVYDRLVHQAPVVSSSQPLQQDKRLIVEGERRKGNNIVLDLRDKTGSVGGRRRASSGGSAEHYPLSSQVATPGKEKKHCAVDWEGLRDMLEMAAVKGKPYAS